jgi:CheY-like chemotaxis protein
MRESKLKRVLLIDDDHITNYLHTIVLQDTGVVQQIQTAETVQDALTLLDAANQQLTATPDLIFLDLNMPGLNGWDFMDAYQKRKEQYSFNSVIVVLTTSVNPDDSRRANQNKTVAEFRHKPLTNEMVQDIVQKYF